MKHWEIRRALLVVMMFCVFLFIYLYWQQSTKSLPALVVTYKNTYDASKRPKSGVGPRWTWECVNRRCERRPTGDVDGAAPVAASTCAMLCGSTQLWPQPTGPVTMGSRAVNFGRDQIRFDDGDVAGDVKILLDEATSRFSSNIASLIRDEENSEAPSDVKRFLVLIRISRPEEVKLKLRTDETYDIDLRYVDGELNANITAKTFFGARHGLETLSQLVWWDDYVGTLKVFRVATVRDAPAFPYRGLMIDTSRNFMSLSSLRRVLDGMASSKLNVFHWHVSDSQSFPLEVPSVPLLAKTGAYGPDMVYEAEEVKELVGFARARGIRVVIEVDTPAHAGNGWTWGPKEGLGELAVCVNERPWSLYCGEPPCGQLNPDNPHVFDLLERLYRDLLDLTDEREIFHIGGDEVNLECWAQHLQRSQPNSPYGGGGNYSDLHDLWGEFTTRALARLTAANRGERVPHVIVWSSNLSKRPYLGKYLDRGNIVVQSWGASQWPDTPDLIADGYKVIVSHVDAWYLDCGFGRWRETGEAACDPYRPWQTVYAHRPWQQFGLDKRQILGGEACLWSEQVDESSVDARLWPRAAAFAERVWTDPQLDASAAFVVHEDVYTRLSTHRERLAARGLDPEAMWPRWCAQNPGMCL